MKIEIRPIEKKSWHGKTGKESIKQDIRFQVRLNHRTGKFDTGLDETVRSF